MNQSTFVEQFNAYMRRTYGGLLPDLARSGGWAPRRIEVLDKPARDALTEVNVCDIVAEIGRQEKSQIICGPESNGNLNGGYVKIGDSGGTCAFWFAYAVPGVATINKSGITGGGDFATAGEGKSLSLVTAAGAHYFWFNTGDETEPAGTGTAHQVIINTSYTALQVLEALRDAIISELSLEVTVSGISGFSSFIVTDIVAGAHADSADVDSGFTVSIDVVAADAAAEPAHGATRSIYVPGVTLGQNADGIGLAILTAALTDGAWSDEGSGAIVALCDIEPGAREDISSTVFSVATTVQGVDPGGTYLFVNPYLLGGLGAYALLNIED